MLALVAAIVFLLAALGVTIGTVNIGYLGLFFLALHFAVGSYVPHPWRRP